MFAEIEPVFFWDGGEDFDDFGVELCARAAANCVCADANLQEDFKSIKVKSKCCVSSPLGPCGGFKLS